MKSRLMTSFSVLLVAMLVSEVAAQSRWNQFRGPSGQGIAPDKKPLPATLDDSTRIWSQSVPLGHSSPCIWDERIFLTTATDRDVQTRCFVRSEGNWPLVTVWVEKALTDMFESRHRINSAATPTPCTDGERVFVYFGSCGLICYAYDGTELWMRRMRIPENMYGTAASPILAGGKLIFLNDNATGSYLEAIDPATGATIWRKDRPNFTAGWSTPMHWTNGDVDEIVCYGVGWLTAYALEDGDERWSIPGLTDEPCITPVAGDGLVYITSYNMRTNPEVIGLPDYTTLLEQYDTDKDGELAYAEIRPNRSILSRFDADGEGDHPLPGFFRFLDRDRSGKVTEQEWQRMYAFLEQFKFANALIAIRPGQGEEETEIVWQYNRGVPECPSPLYHDGLVYMIKNGGIVTCLDARTGEKKYQSRLDAGGPYYASPVVGDGKIYFASARGEVTVIEAGDELNILARNELNERIMATPALVEGVVYMRTEENLHAFGVASNRPGIKSRNEADR